MDRMAHWLIGLLCSLVLLGFIGFALRQGTKVKPGKSHDWDNTGGGEYLGGGHDGGGHFPN